MEFKKYQHIEKLGTTEVEGILKGKVYLYYKIDGTNSCVYLKNDKSLGFGSRNRELSLDKDNGNFMTMMMLNKELYINILNYLLLHPNYIIYGEWLIPHTIRRYNESSWNKMYVFDVYDEENNRYLVYEEYSLEIKKLGLECIPPLKILENPSMEDIKNCLEETGNYLIIEGLGEGIVIKNYDYRNQYGRVTWAKILTEDFNKTKEYKSKVYQDNKIDVPMEFKIIKNFLTIDFVYKEFNKFKEEKGEFTSKNTFEFLNKSFIEFYKDNWNLILKKFKLPTINFRNLKKIYESEVKEILYL